MGDVFQALKIARAAGELRFFIYNIRKNSYKKIPKNMTVTLLWTPNSVMASKLLTCFISTKNYNAT